MLTSILTDIYNAILMDIFNSQPATEEDPDEGIKDLVEITLKKFVSTLATPPPKKINKNYWTIIAYVIHIMPGNWLLSVGANFKAKGVSDPFLRIIDLNTCKPTNSDSVF